MSIQDEATYAASIGQIKSQGQWLTESLSARLENYPVTRSLLEDACDNLEVFSMTPTFDTALASYVASAMFEAAASVIIVNVGLGQTPEELV